MDHEGSVFRKKCLGLKPKPPRIRGVEKRCKEKHFSTRNASTEMQRVWPQHLSRLVGVQERCSYCVMIFIILSNSKSSRGEPYDGLWSSTDNGHPIAFQILHHPLPSDAAKRDLEPSSNSDRQLPATVISTTYSDAPNKFLQVKVVQNIAY